MQVAVVGGFGHTFAMAATVLSLAWVALFAVLGVGIFAWRTRLRGVCAHPVSPARRTASSAALTRTISRCTTAIWVAACPKSARSPASCNSVHS